jgi:hypothetical protein
MAIAQMPVKTATEEHYEPERRLWSVAEFERLIDAGFFGPEERVELIEGEVVRKVTQNPPHSTALRKAERAINRVFVEGFDVRPQMPLSFGEGSGNRPEPDLAVVTGSPEDYALEHPRTAVLVIEVSDATLDYDRTTKAGVYARANIPELWIVNLPDRALDVYRQPGPMTGFPQGHFYGNVTRYTEAETVAPLAVPQSAIVVADLLP